MTTIEKLRTLARELAGEAWDYRSPPPARAGARPPVGGQGGDEPSRQRPRCGCHVRGSARPLTVAILGIACGKVSSVPRASTESGTVCQR